VLALSSWVRPCFQISAGGRDGQEPRSASLLLLLLYIGWSPSLRAPATAFDHPQKAPLSLAADLADSGWAPAIAERHGANSRAAEADSGGGNSGFVGEHGQLVFRQTALLPHYNLLRRISHGIPFHVLPKALAAAR
jgi:hypothetical protein